jgi:4-hydroxy-tetrahydrodipicolinate synthase
LTPDSLDIESLARLLDHILAGGVHGVFVLGTTGEGPALGLDLAKEFIARTGALLRGRVPLLVGVTHASTSDALVLARAAADAGADAVVTAGPCYFPVTQPELVAWTTRFAASSPLPVFLYNMPSHAHVCFAESSVIELARVPNIVGLKDSSGEVMYLHGLVRAILPERPDFALIIGPEELTAEAVLLGVHGGVNGGANLFPKLYVDVYNAAVAGDVATLRRLHKRVIDISRRLYGSSYLPASSALRRSLD